ncbi:NFX1-type zinc finger-containing protein 1 [Tetrabaena socialis]|uniref:NFX1-type zinc finger-containing protein 1 n=1 Tax=Tetrabaena socialis TaxID=47790 RepID=A0A2J7ZRA0_9CHLO|nr:NFX1-type zinc finger-containing protein 1 [Tetrabaena socialis]|eukprot:PNH02770.1 NFX1-type zinc finger-containing protein 1 [Tetrabaena socialis]
MASPALRGELGPGEAAGAAEVGAAMEDGEEEEEEEEEKQAEAEADEEEEEEEPSFGVARGEKARLRRLEAIVAALPVEQRQLPEIQTVDSYQGREKKIMLVSLVRSNGKGLIGFMKDPRRMCVALSRAQAQLYIFGDQRTLRRKPRRAAVPEAVAQKQHAPGPPRSMSLSKKDEESAKRFDALLS